MSAATATAPARTVRTAGALHPHGTHRAHRRSGRGRLRTIVAFLADGPTVRSSLLEVDGLRGPFG